MTKLRFNVMNGTRLYSQAENVPAAVEIIEAALAIARRRIAGAKAELFEAMAYKLDMDNLKIVHNEGSK